MAYAGFREFLEKLEKEGELKRIKTPVDPVLEITEIADRVVRSGGPALLFENPKGSNIPLVIGVFATRKRMSMALGVGDIEEIAKEIEEWTKLPSSMPSGLMAKAVLLPQIGELAKNTAPRMVSHGQCQEVVKTGDQIKLSELPILKCWPLDGGRFITLPLVFTKSVDGKRNVGMYRVQVYDETTCGMHWQRHKVGNRHHGEYEAQGRNIPVAVALGGDPALTYAATAPLPDMIDEMVFAGFLRKKPVELVKCKTQDIEVPADAEIILEGYVPANERRTEGPFGDHTGFYTLEDEYPVFHVTAITHRKNPVYPTTIVGRPPIEDEWLGKATERLFLPLVRLFVPEIIDYNLPAEACFHNLCIIKIKKRYPGQAQKVMNAIWGLGQMMFTKVIIVVDEWVDVQNLKEVLWVTTNNIDPERDTLFTRGPIDVLDHASRQMGFGSKMGIDATQKLPEEGFTRPWPPVIEMDASVKKRVDTLWSQLGL
ncbi:menaquinone biosynthesis decarboxylase [Armatimonas sp.]|uniref:menaquinone biosynthesis decarboxylase n=1 Tax=Armatimonas sp. TaxID=1872638 RepID=UPI00286AB47B|nr:menaquinone biosynthesis decarboxylase [Armatimonas sp.]